MSTIILKIEDTDSGEVQFTALSETGYNGASRAHQFAKALNENLPAVMELLISKTKKEDNHV